MSKIQRISGLQYNFSLFSINENYDVYYSRFLESDLGKIYLGIPWLELSKSFGLEDQSKGPMSIFSPRGKCRINVFKALRSSFG